MNHVLKKFSNGLKSLINYYHSRYENNIFLDKIKKFDQYESLNPTYSKQQVSNIYPGLEAWYPVDDFKEKLGVVGLKVNNVAVIFNSGIILENNWGTQIDKHDLVIRINFLPTLGYEKQTGSRTDIRIMGRNWIFKEKDELIIHTYNNIDYYYRDIEIFQSSLKAQNQVQLYVLNNTELDELYNLFGGNISNGLRAVWLGLCLGDKVNVYGADPASKTWYRGKKLSHFPGERELKSIKEAMRPYQLKHQEYERYFGKKVMSKDKVTTIHNTINREYLFYEVHPKIKLIY